MTFPSHGENHIFSWFSAKGLEISNFFIIIDEGLSLTSNGKESSPLLFEEPLPAKVVVEVLAANPRPAHWYGSYYVIIMSVVTLNALFFQKYL